MSLLAGTYRISTSSSPHCRRLGAAALLAGALSAAGWAPGAEEATTPSMESAPEVEKAPAAGKPSAAPDFSKLSIEELMNIEVTTVSRKAEKLLDAPAAVYVITQEEIRRSGARSIPEALRLAPGIDVAQIDSNKWAVSARGFNGRYANKLLVLMDGRSVYNHEFSGVYWDAQDTLIEDIDRIEVIRGPGGTLWGANAVNGVINIITKSAKDTQGGLANAGGGDIERGFLGGRYGFKLGENTWARIFAKYNNRDSFVNAAAERMEDEWEALRTGFRLDSGSPSDNSLRVQGDLFYNELGNDQAFPSSLPPYSEISNQSTFVFGGDLQAAWTHAFSDASSMTLQTYYDAWKRNDPMYTIDKHAIDIDFQHRFALGRRNDVLWGLNYRVNIDEMDPKRATLRKDSEVYDLAGFFVQDTIKIVEDRLALTLGSKFDYNDYTDFEAQPSARAVLTPHPRHAIWGAVSRAVRTPSQGERDSNVPRLMIPPSPPLVPLPTRVDVLGNRGLKSEDLLSFELGYRTQALDNLAFDVAGFFNLYEDLRHTEPGTPYPAPGFPPFLILPMTIENRERAKTWGVETAADWQVTKFWKLAGTFTFFEMDGGSEGENPTYQAGARSRLDLPWKLEFDTSLYYVDSLPSLDVPGYVRLDFRLGWRPTEDLEVSFALQNSLDDRHPEFVSEAFDLQAEVPRSFFGMITVRF